LAVAARRGIVGQLVRCEGTATGEGEAMGKERITKKDVKKKPVKTLKEKRKEKSEKKSNNPQTS
jgi:hypothetical protein